VDTLVLGCTHYSILKNVLRRVAGEEVTLVDSAEAVASWLADMLPQPQTEGAGGDSFFVSDNEDKFRHIASRILSAEVERLQKVSLGETWFVEQSAGEECE